jgi:hypothetical protein
VSTSKNFKVNAIYSCPTAEDVAGGYDAQTGGVLGLTRIEDDMTTNCIHP